MNGHDSSATSLAALSIVTHAIGGGEKSARILKTGQRDRSGQS